MNSEGNKPNIMLIMVDQQRYDCIGYAKVYPVRTPHIDHLASQGMWFEQAYTPIPLCSPARQCFLSGRRAEAMGTLWNYDLGPHIPPMPSSEYSWPRDLQEQGYRNGYVGKWHVHPTEGPMSYGYNEHISEFEYESFRQDKYPDQQWTQGFSGEIDPVPLEDTETHWLTARACEMLEDYAQQSGPWHIRLDLREPHLPCRPSERFASMYDPAQVPQWRSFKDTFLDKPYIQKQQLVNWRIENYTWEDWAPIVARYYAIISQVDDAVGRMLHALERLRMDKNTIVIFTTDHGDMCGGHRMMDKHYVLYDDIVRVPMIIRWPGVVSEGSVNSQFVYNMLDLPPTLLEIVGIEPRSFFHGSSILPFLKGSVVENWRKAVVSTYNGQQFGLYTQRMLRYHEWKYIWNTTDVDELYDLVNDPDELENRIHDISLAHQLERMRKELYEVLRHEGDSLVNNMWMEEQLLQGRKL